MVLYVEGDIFTSTASRHILCHQTNCKGKFGAGLAKDIRERFPHVYKKYMADYHAGKLILGYVSFVATGKDRYIANLCGQDAYGRDKRYTDYDALRVCLKKVAAFSREKDCSVLLPNGLGSGLAGGSWEIVSAIIDEVFMDTYAFVFKKEE